MNAEQTALDLHEKVSAQCPIWGVSIMNLSNKSTWRIDYRQEATSTQQQAAQAVIDGYVLVSAP